ncbi:MAG: outer membrane beta-barrel protein [Pseudomonadota bacterium]
MKPDEKQEPGIGFAKASFAFARVETVRMRIVGVLPLAGLVLLFGSAALAQETQGLPEARTLPRLDGLNPALAFPIVTPSPEASEEGDTESETEGQTADTGRSDPLLLSPRGTVPAAQESGDIVQRSVPPEETGQTAIENVPQVQGGTVAAVPADSFASEGIRRGRFVFRPSIETSGGFTSNSTNDVTGSSSIFSRAQPELVVESDFSRHALGFRGTGTFARFESGDDPSDIGADISVDGRYDLDPDTSLSAILQLILVEDDLTGVADDPLERVISGSVQFDHQLRQLETETELTVTRNLNGSFIDAAGVLISQDDLNSVEISGRARGTIRRGAVFEPFAEVTIGREIFDEDVDEFGNERNVTALRGVIGVAVDRGEKFSGDIGVGFGRNLVDGDAIEDFGGFIADISLVWSPRRPTAVTFTGSTVFDSFPSLATPGDITYTANVGVTHDLTERFELSADGGLIFQVDGGAGGFDTTLSANLGIDYEISPAFTLRAAYGFVRQFTPGGFADFTANTIQINLRAER